MQLKNKVLWQEHLANNDDGRIDTYGGSVHFFAELWALLMEAEIANGKELEAVADECSRRANEIMGRYSMTGFQYGCAVSVLAGAWDHGEALRKWHNLEMQVDNEGERANKSGGVLNPALLCVGVKDRQRALQD